MDLGSTSRAVFRPVGTRAKQALTLGTHLHAALGEQRRIQYTVQGQDGGAEPFADQRVGDTLRADTFLAIVQEQTISAIVVAAAMMNFPAPFSKNQNKVFHRCFNSWFNVAEGG